MTILPLVRIIEDKLCFVYCGPERCNCKRGNMDEWLAQETLLEQSRLNKSMKKEDNK